MDWFAAGDAASAQSKHWAFYNGAYCACAYLLFSLRSFSSIDLRVRPDVVSHVLIDCYFDVVLSPLVSGAP